MTAAEDRRLHRVILDLLDARRPGATICPSDAARHAARDAEGGGWRDLMDPVRRAAADLVAEGRVEVTQRGSVVDLASARGPIRIRRAR